MRFLAHALTALVLLLVPVAANAAQPAATPSQQTPAAAADTAPKPFAHHEIAQDAERYETYLKANWIMAGRPAVDLRSEGERNLGNDPRGASRSATALL